MITAMKHSLNSKSHTFTFFLNLDFSPTFLHKKLSNKKISPSYPH